MKNEFETYLGRIAEMAMQRKNIPDFPGLFYGKMGVVVFLCQYSSYTQNSKCIDFAIDLIKEINRQIYGKGNINYHYGLSGIGVAIEYLIQNNYFEADADDVLDDFDYAILFSFNKIDSLLSFSQIHDVGKYSVDLSINNSNQQLIERVMLSLLSGNEAEIGLLNLLMQNAETGKYCLFDGRIGVGLTLLSCMDKKYATWFDLL